MKKTGAEWAEFLELTVVEPNGWFSAKDFLSNKISKFEFLNRCVDSVVKKPQNSSSRREISKFRESLKKI